MVASVVGKIGRRMVKSRNTKGKRTDLARERAERNLNKKRAEYKMTKKEGRALAKVTKATKPPKGKKMMGGGKVKGYKKGGSVSSASKRADGIAQQGHTRGRMV